METIFTNKDSSGLKTFIVTGRSTVTRNRLMIEIHAPSKMTARAMFCDAWPTFKVETVTTDPISIVPAN